MKKPGGLPTGKNPGRRDDDEGPSYETPEQRRRRRRAQYLRQYNDPRVGYTRPKSEGRKKTEAARNFESGQRGFHENSIGQARPGGESHPTRRQEYLIRNNPNVGDPSQYRNQTHQGHEAARVRYFDAGQRLGHRPYTDATFRSPAQRRTPRQNAEISKGARKVASRASNLSDVGKAVSIMKAAKRRLSS